MKSPVEEERRCLVGSYEAVLYIVLLLLSEGMLGQEEVFLPTKDLEENHGNFS
jgi:hypothetical protein